MNHKTALLFPLIGLVIGAAWFTYLAVGDGSTVHWIACVGFWLAALVALVRLVMFWK
jgi:hypothetical protein